MPISRPQPDEYAPYYGQYIQRVPEGEIFDLLRQQIDKVHTAFAAISPAQADFKFEEGAWSIKELLGHICDAERIFAYRALWFSRNGPNAIPGFDQDDFVRESHYNERTLPDLLDEFEALRRANVLGFQHLSEEDSLRRGIASDNPVSVRALLYMMVGHVEAHLESLAENYIRNLK